MKKLLNKKGFTLIELIVVIAILAILALILVPSILNYVSQANDAKNQANARGEYSRVALLVATANNDATKVVTTGGTQIISGSTTGYTLGTGSNVLTCTATFDVSTGNVSQFACTGGGKTYSKANDFVPTP